jgi:hypothetical protein
MALSFGPWRDVSLCKAGRGASVRVHPSQGAPASFHELVGSGKTAVGRMLHGEYFETKHTRNWKCCHVIE